MIRFNSQIRGRDITNEHNQPITKEQAFSSILIDLSGKEKKLDPTRLIAICASASRQENEVPQELSPQSFKYLKELAKNTGTNYFSTKDYPSGFSKFLSIAFMCLKGQNAFINGRFDYPKFKLWISSDFGADTNIHANDIPNKYLEGITIDHDGNIRFGRRNYNQCTVNIKAPFITETYANGDSYTGNFVNDKKNGQGTYTFPDGASYTGNFVDNKKNGQGTYTFPDGASYTGNFVNDKMNGQGTYTFPNGASYTGNWVDNKRNGQGTYTFPDGRQYQGTWVNSRCDEVEKNIIKDLIPSTLPLAAMLDFQVNRNF